MSHSRPCSSAEPSLCFDVNKTSDVFLSFRGPDTREGFVRRLYSALDREGINTFLDEESLEKGDHIPSCLETGIKESRICIPIFSKRFPESKWCLQEVSLMVKYGLKICPLFYDVLPKDLRCWDGSEYAEYFKQHESQQRLSSELILEYKNALRNVSDLNGWCFNQLNGRDDDLLIQRVVADVQKSLHSNKMYLDISECFGLDGSVNNLKRLLNVVGHQKKMVKVGLHGMGGIGKTTLAKIVCKELPFSQFQVFCFVPSVGERSQEANGLVKLQTHMLKCISRFRGEVDHVDQGKGLLQDWLRGKRILLLLDDIESAEQLEALAGNYRDFGVGSCVIITSRDEHILKMANVDVIYEVRRLAYNHAMQLFNFHAFLNSCCVDQELQTLSHDIVSACEGLPLALQLLGKSLFGEGDRDVWKEMVGKLRCEPNLHKKLRVSYDSLDSLEKEMFHDIACFFTWREKEIVMIFWEGLIQSPHASLRSLLQKSFVSFGCSNEFLMHRCLRDLGRSISNEISREPRKRTRVFDEDDAHHVLRQPSKKAKLVRYFSYEPKEPMTLKAEMFKSLYNLWFLRLADIGIEGHFSEEFSLGDLRWLSLRKFSSKRLPQGMNLRSLVILEVTDSQITHLWDETTEDPTMRPGNLKVLILRGCASLESLPATLCYTPLQMLDLHNCHSLSSLPNTVGSWASLVTLDMEGCSVSSLPRDFGDLVNLKELNLSRCRNLSVIPASFGNLTRLERLEIHHNDKLTELPDSFCGLKSLAHLDFSYCHSLSSLPNTVGSLISLVCLEMEECSIYSLPQNLCNLANLQELNLSYCQHLSSLPANFGNLTRLERLQIPHIPGLTELPNSFGGLKTLAYLDASYCGLTDNGLPATISELCALKIIHLEGNRICRLPSGLEKLTQLEELHVDDCRELAVLSALPSSLQLLYARNCFGLNTICCLPALPSLMTLDVSKSCHLTQLHGLVSLKQLTTLNLVGCSGIFSCGVLESCLTGLTALECVFVGGPGVSSAQLQIFYDSYKDFSFRENCLLANLDAPVNWLQGEACGQDGYSIDYCTEKNKVENCAGYIVCLVSSGQVQIREDCGVNPGINRLSYTIERDDSLLTCPVNHQNSTIDGGDYLEVRLVRAETTPDFAWLKGGDKVRVNARSDYENWKASFKFLMYEETTPSHGQKPPKMITFVM
ncbi:TMV resistance protein N-like isoform X1 [Cryptomeria japonica]|uniref:TMV resistance protein N-like isoform X1 n=2 Tax=Cryptomeria japonica TaxID=3369 RepID=UPI0027D9EB80|nr:TMV resistance protein N-like isoform X1 [Cryptomeria japonica]